MITRGEISNRNHLQTRLVNASAAATADNDVILVDATAGVVTITLPDAVGNKNLHLSIKKIDSSANAVTIATTNSQLIDGASTQTIPTQWQQIEVIADGTAWQTLSVNPADVTGFNGGTVTTPIVVSSASASALVVGANGATNPVLKVDDSVASVATGITIQGKAAGAGVGITVLSSGANEGLTITTKGTGGVSIVPGTNNAAAFTVFRADGTSVMIQANSSQPQITIGTGINIAPQTGALVFQSYLNSTAAFLFKDNTLATTILSMDSTSSRVGINKGTPLATLDVNGNVLLSGTLTAGGLLTCAIQVATAGPLIYSGSGVPTISAAVKGSLYLRSDGTSTSTRMYVATDAAGTWTAVTTAA